MYWVLCTLVPGITICGIFVYKVNSDIVICEHCTLFAIAAAAAVTSHITTVY